MSGREVGTEPVEVLHEGSWLRLVRRGRWEYVERTHAGGDVVVVLATTPDDEVLFVEQSRIPVESTTIEFPAGLVGDHEDPDEDVTVAACRELEEETGWTADDIEVVVAGSSSAGMSNEVLTFCRATGLRRIGPGGGDDGEQITVHAVPRDRAAAWINRRGREGASLDLKLWTGLWLLDHDMDGTPRS